MSLRSLSDRHILTRIHELTRHERAFTLQVLLHLNEIERRRLHLKQGYSSLFDYCTSGLGYSVPAAVRRIQTARCVRRFPEVLALLESNEVNLSTVSQVSRVLSASNKDALLARIRGKSHREVKAIVVEYQPCVSPRDVVRPVMVRLAALPASVPTLAPAASTGRSEPADGLPIRGADCEKSDYIRIGCASERPAERPPISSETGAPRTEKRIQFQFTASEAFVAKLEKVRSLAWHRLSPDASLEEVFELVMNAYLEANDPEKRRQRRAKRVQVRSEAPRRQDEDAVGQRPEARPQKQPQIVHPDARRIPLAVRDEVYSRDKGRCTFVGSTGRRCKSTRALQLDHVVPVARGGTGTGDNLRLLCAYHNRLEAERLMGVGCSVRTIARRESAPLRR